MSGTKSGGEAAARTNKARYGEDFYVNMGRSGGKISKGGGFATPEGRLRAVEAGRAGGKASRRRTATEIAEAKSEGSRYNEDYQPEQKSWLKRLGLR